MHLKSLTLKGFKSFAAPTTFALEPGVTAIVGPNGSGKSNVVDALAWVMGEQGAKTLRGGTMEDVIFAGTSTRGPLGRAEVQLTIDNADGALPIAYSEVSIRRTLFRNGNSDYAINGQTCRLLDVQELLSDSGLGRQMHVIVGQGRLDAVLAATPEQRRGFIEEAAGILKHRRRKEKTVRKLQAMEANLTRLRDLSTELRRQLKPLGRQAEVARQAATIAAVVRDAKARLYADELVGLRRELDAAAHDEQERHAEQLVLQDQLTRLHGRIGHLEQDQRSEAVDTARSTVSRLEQVQERIRGLYALAGQRLALLADDAGAPTVAPTVTTAMIDDARAAVAELTAGVGGAQDAVDAAGRAVVRARGDLDALDADIAAQSALVSAHDMRIAALRGTAEAAASALAAVRVAVTRQERALEAATARRTDAEEALRTAAPPETEDEASAAHTAAYDDAQRAVAETEEEAAAARETAHAAERERDALTAQVGALTRALDVRSATAELLASGVPGVRGPVVDAVRVRAGFEAAIAAALGPIGDGVLVGTRADARRAARTVGAGDHGAADIAVADVPGVAAEPPLGALVRAADVVAAPDGILALLRDVHVADDLDDAMAAVAGARPSTTIVTRDGEVVTPFTVHAGSGSDRSRLELTAERDAAAERLTRVGADVEALGRRLSAAEAAQDAARRQARDALAALRAHDADLAARAEAANRVTVRHEAAVAECERLATTLQQAQRAVTDAEDAQRVAQEQLDTALEAPRPILDAAARDGVLAALEAARDADMHARLEAETLRERVRAEEGRVTALRRRREAEQQAAQAAARRAAVRRAQRDVAAAVAAAVPALMDSADRSVSQARVQLATAESARAAQTAELTELRGQDSALRERLTALGDAVHAMELRVHEKRLHVTRLRERAQSELGLDDDVLIAEYGPDVPLPGAEEDAPLAFDRAEGQKRLQDAERKLAQLGRVNPLALEEFEALEQRHRFLTEQLADLTQTRTDLLTIIGELDERMQTIFQAAFEDTKAAFADVFPLLFPGGTGSIFLTDPDDLLATGVEVAARPAGKKIERLSLLSGGERSLAAVALLTAIFMARPSPFYILDEVEAALDDANLGRLLTVFERLRVSSQLIVITHQKRTMEIADALYGVSMRHDGVSAVVGQRVGDRGARVAEPAAS